MSRVVGPGSYNVNYEPLDAKRSVAFTKASRFQQGREEQQQLELNPNYDAVRRKPPMAVM